MSYTPFKMKGPSLYNSPNKKTEDDDFEKDIKAEEKSKEKMKESVKDSKKEAEELEIK